MDGVGDVKRIVMKVLMLQIPEAMPEYVERQEGGKEKLELVLHLKKMNCVGFTIDVGSLYERYLNYEIPIGVIIRNIVQTYHHEEARIYQRLLKEMQTEEFKILEKLLQKRLEEEKE